MPSRQHWPKMPGRSRRVGRGCSVKKVLLILVACASFPRLLMAASVPEKTALTAPARQVSPGRGARHSIEHFDTVLLGVMKQARALGFKGRYARLAPEVKRLFDFHAIAMLSMGSRWDKLSPADQRILERTMRRYTTATYAGRFNGYSGERFSVKRSALLSADVKVVYSVFTEHNGKIHNFDYLMRPAGNRWRVINVVADGVSDLSVKRAEFAHVLKTKGFAGLIARLNQHIAHMAHGG